MAEFKPEMTIYCQECGAVLILLDHTQGGGVDEVYCNAASQHLEQPGTPWQQELQKSRQVKRFMSRHIHGH